MSSRKPLSKAEKTLFFVCVFAVLPLAAVVFIAGTRDADPDWNIPPAVARPNPNGYDFYVAAAKATVRFKPEIDPASDVRSQPSGSAYALKNYSLARRNQWLNANAKTWALFQQGLKTPSMAPVSDDGFMLRDWGKFRQLARDVSARSRTFQMAHQPMQTTMSALDGMQMGTDATRGANLIGHLVGQSIMAISRGPLDDWNKTINQLDASQAKTAAKRLETILSRQSTLKQSLEVEKHDSLLLLKQAMESPGWRGGWTSRFNNGESFLAEGVGQKVVRHTISKKTVWSNANRALDDRIQSAAIPYSKIQGVPMPPNLDIFSKDFYVAPSVFLRNEARHSTANTMLLLRLALRAHIAQNKTAPPTLSVLVPGILKTVPTDIYNDGKPLFYKPNGATYKLWSVGPDGKNDGGVPFPPRSLQAAKYPVQNTLDNKGDFVAGACR